MKVQKISLNAGFSCPNRDGTIGTGGCSYCRNDSFTPGYCMHTPSVTSQIEHGKAFFARKYKDMKYLAYFQSYTNTYATNTDALETLYDEALACQDVVGLVIGTRPDTLPDETLNLLADIAHRVPVFLEIGAESAHNDTLVLVNRHHTWEQVVSAVTRAADKGLHCGLHLIAGLPGETDKDVLTSVDAACNLPIDTLKLHQLQILEGTPLYHQWKNGEISVPEYSLEDYLELCVEITRRVPEHIVIERFLAQSPPQLVVSPKWNIKNYQFMHLLDAWLKKQQF